MKRSVFLVVACLLTIYPAAAQNFITPHGSNFQFFQLPQVLPPVQGDAAPSNIPKQNAQPQSDSAKLAALTFTPSLKRRKDNITSFIAKTRAQDPAGAEQMQQMFAAVDMFAEMEKALVPYGLRIDNVADAYAVWWSSAWLASRGLVDAGSREQAQAIKAQATNGFLATPVFAKATDAQKQQFAEALLIQAAMIDAAVEQAKGNPEQLKAVGQAVRQGAKASGLDLDKMELTPTGFVPAG